MKFLLDTNVVAELRRGVVSINRRDPIAAAALLPKTRSISPQHPQLDSIASRTTRQFPSSITSALRSTSRLCPNPTQAGGLRNAQSGPG